MRRASAHCCSRDFRVGAQVHYGGPQGCRCHRSDFPSCMDGNREREQLDAEARALKATLMRYMSEAMLEDQGLGKLSAELTKLVQASQRHAAESTARSEQKVQALAAT